MSLNDLISGFYFKKKYDNGVESLSGENSFYAFIVTLNIFY